MESFNSILRALDDKLRTNRRAIELRRRFAQWQAFTDCGENLELLSEEVEVLRQAILDNRDAFNGSSTEIDHLKSLVEHDARRCSEIDRILQIRAEKLKFSPGNVVPKRDASTISQLFQFLENVKTYVTIGKKVAKVLYEYHSRRNSARDPSQPPNTLQTPATKAQHTIDAYSTNVEVGQQFAVPQRVTRGHRSEGPNRKRWARPSVHDLSSIYAALGPNQSLSEACNVGRPITASDVLGAVENGDQTLLARAFRDYPFFRAVRNAQDVTLMGIAIQHSRLDIVEFLLDENFDIDERFGQFGSTALREALRCRQIQITKLLIDRGASFDSRNNFGQTPIYALWTLEFNKPSVEFLKLLYDHKDFDRLHLDVFDAEGWSVIARASCFASAEDLEFLLRIGLDPFVLVQDTGRQTGHEGWSTLGLATWYGVPESVKTLSRSFSSGRIDQEDRYGNTALQYAVHRDQLEIAVYLLLQGADPFKTARVTWLTNDDVSPEQGHTAISLLTNASAEFRTIFYNWVCLLQLPEMTVPPQMRTPSIPIMYVRPVLENQPAAHSLFQLSPSVLSNIVGHEYGDVSNNGGSLHQGDQHIALQLVNNIYNTNLVQGMRNGLSVFNLGVSKSIAGWVLRFQFDVLKSEVVV